MENDHIEMTEETVEMTEETVDVVATSTLTVPLVEPLPGEEVDYIPPSRLVADRNNATFHFLLSSRAS